MFGITTFLPASNQTFVADRSHIRQFTMQSEHQKPHLPQVFFASTMPKVFPELLIGEADPAMLIKLAGAKRAFLTATALIAIVTLAFGFIPPLGRLYPDGWHIMRTNSAFATLFCALSLHLSEPRYNRRLHLVSQLLALVVTLMTAAVLYEYLFHASPAVDTLLAFGSGFTVRFSGKMSPPSACGFLFLAIAILPIRGRGRLANLTADLLVSSLCLVTLVLVSGQVFDAMQMFGISSSSVQSSPLTLFCLVLLTLVAVLCRAENGIFSILLGRGIGSRIARTLAPILLVVAFAREGARAHLVQALRIPENYATAILGSIATAVSFVVLLFLTWRIHAMETEIHDLSLRDELTGLQNLRGFQMLAEQALRVASRSQMPISVLFIDLDNLKDINDTLGHSAGSACLVETANMIKRVFRESDVTGRIGGDEFAVVCQCSKVAISIAAQRLEEACAERNTEAGRQFPFSFSIGYFTSDERAHPSLKHLLAEADKAMYEEKKRRKLNRD
jgi:diguanylate cyclase (GGDEF)-like protein